MVGVLCMLSACLRTVNTMQCVIYCIANGTDLTDKPKAKVCNVKKKRKRGGEGWKIPWRQSLKQKDKREIKKTPLSRQIPKRETKENPSFNRKIEQKEG